MLLSQLWIACDLGVLLPFLKCIQFTLSQQHNCIQL
jgi:hypothetical protein